MFAGTQTRRVDPLQWTRQVYACSQRKQTRTVAANGRKDAHTTDLYVTACTGRRALGARCRDIEHRVNAAAGDRVVESIDVDRRVRCRCGPEARLNDWPPRTMRMQVEARGKQTCPVLSSTMTPSMAMKRSGAGPGEPKHGFISHFDHRCRSCAASDLAHLHCDV
jgi:hypothetical protein